MLRGSREDGTRRRPLFAAAAFLLVAGLMSTGPASAHTFTKTDGNDSPGKLDVRTASVNHGNNKVVHTVRTFEGWTPKNLGNDSFFIIEIDKNFDDDFEQCAFIFFAGGRLRGSLTNCRRTFIRSLPVSKPSKAVASITVPTANTGMAYRWVAFSFWSGLPARCSDRCFDAAPNRPPPILHDLVRPVVDMSAATLRVAQGSTTTTFGFPFTVSDAHSGIASWRVQRRPLQSSTWENVVSASGGGAQNPLISGTEGTHYLYRVVTKDKQGNQTIGPSRTVYVPIDDTSIDPADFTGTPSTIEDTDAFGGSYQALDAGEVLTLDLAEFDECIFELTGPGSGDWIVEVHLNGGGPFVTLDASDFADAQRQLLLEGLGCVDPSILTFTVVSGSGFGIDAFVGPA